MRKMTFAKPALLVIMLCVTSSVVMAEEAPVVDRSNTYVDASSSNERENNYFSTNDESEQLASHKQAPEQTAYQGHSNNALLLSQIAALRQELNELRGQLEVQSHDLKLLKEEQLAYYKDLDSRLLEKGNNRVETYAKVAEPTHSKAEASNQSSAIELSKATNSKRPDEQLSYAFAYEQIQSKHYDNALKAMSEYIQYFPNGAYTANAYYWKGELLIKKADFSQAMQAFKAVITDFPDSTKVAPAMYKLGTTYALIGDLDSADKTLKEVIHKFPDTATARLAESKLNKINQTA
jgi:tol-pal system protein YbgF